jgi:DNA (cytosine-5)-methyltransferase 1
MRRSELIVDNFAGGGGASLGIEWALGRSPDVAVNHDREALAMHRANHPLTTHYECDVFEVDPRVATRNQPVGLAWFSPDCTHHSKAKGGKPMREAGKKSRSLADVVIVWAEQVKPRVIVLENVEEFRDWGPVVHKVGEDGEPVFDQSTGEPWYVPCPDGKGRFFKQWVSKLRKLGYQVESRELRACDFGAPTIRKRLFVIARCDGRKIRWPKPTHGKVDRSLRDRKPFESRSDSATLKLLPWRTAAEIIDWAIPCHSIFMSPEEAKLLGLKRPLAAATMARIAAGVKRYVLDAAEPFLVVCNHGGDWFRGRSVAKPAATATCSRDATGLVVPFVSRQLVTPYLVSPAHSTTTGRGPNHWPLTEPLRTTTSSNDKFVVAPLLSAYYGDKSGQPQRCAELDEPLKTQPTENRHAFVAAFLAQHNGGMVGRAAGEPVSTLTNRCTQQQVVAANLTHFYSSNTAGGQGDPDRPLKTVITGGHAALVASFLAPYYGSGSGTNGRDLNEPTPTTTTKDRMQLVTVDIGGETFVIEDIGMRMLTPRELFSSQGFPLDYVIDPWMGDRVNKNGRLLKPGPLPKQSQVRMCGNSVCPHVAEAIVRANLRPPRSMRRKLQREMALKSKPVTP